MCLKLFFLIVEIIDVNYRKREKEEKQDHCSPTVTVNYVDLS